MILWHRITDPFPQKHLIRFPIAMQITTRSKSRNLPQKRKSEDDDTGPRPKVPRTTAPAPAPSSEPLTPQPDPHTTRSKTGKLPKKKAEEDIAPTAKALRMATSASDTKPAARVKLDPKLQPKTSTKAKPAPKASSKKQTPGPRTDTQSEDSENKTPAAQPKTTSRTKQPDRSGNLPHQNREPSAPRTGWERTRAQMSESPNDDNEEIKRAKANSRWHEPKVVDKMNLPPMPPKAKPLTRRSGTVLHILVYGNGDHGELGLGIHKHEGRLPTNVDTPQLNRRLRHDYPGVVDVACGRRHSIALTSDGRILTWGWNEYGILGRATDFDLDGPDLRGWEPGTADASHLRDVTWTQVVATDNACFALSDDGCVFGWGTFMVSNFLILILHKGKATDLVLSKTEKSSASAHQPPSREHPPKSTASPTSPTSPPAHSTS